MKSRVQIGLCDGAPHLRKSIFDRPDIEATVTQTVNAITILLTEIEVLRRRYELRPRLIPENAEEEKTRRDSNPDSNRFQPAKHLQQRIKDNQRQKSFLALTKWTVCDAKRFDEKVKRLQNLIDGLEDISKAAGLAYSQGSTQTLPTSIPLPVDNPPPYSVEPPLEQAQRVEIIVPTIPASTSTPDVQVNEQYILLRQYASLVEADAPFRLRAREKLLTLNDGQFKELREDVYDELCRRQQTLTPPPFLHPVYNYHAKRNQAREKMSTLPWSRFSQLVTDVVFDLERRFPSLKNEVQLTVSRALNGQSGAVLTREYTPGLSMPQQLNQANLAALNEVATPTTFTRLSQTSTVLGQASVPLTLTLHDDSFLVVRPPASFPTSPSFKSFRIKKHHPTSKVIPTALKKYGINIPWQKYALYVENGSVERQLELHEKPAAVFKSLKQHGYKPIFTLRRIPSTVEEDFTEE